MHVGVVEICARAVDHKMVPSGAVVAAVLDRAAAGRDQRDAAFGEPVVALVGVAGPAGAEPRAGAAVVVPAAHREDVVEEVEGVALDVAGLGARSA